MDATLVGGFTTFIWIIMMRFVAAVMVWASIILSILLLGKVCLIFNEISKILLKIAEGSITYAQCSRSPQRIILTFRPIFAHSGHTMC